MTALAGRVARGAWRALTWPLRSLWRLLVLGWLIGVCIVGSASLAAADPGLIGGPDLTGGAAQTVYEQAPWYGYGLPTFAGGPGQGWTEKTMWGALNLITLVINALSAVLVRGALAAMQWMLDLTLYRDNAAAMDTATQGVASAVFYPLIGCTVAVAGFTMYARARRDGGGSILGEALKVGVLGVLAISFVLAPSKIVSPMDDARTAASDAIMTGYSSNTVAGDNPAGFPAVTIPSGPGSASRRLADSMWSTFVVTPWCYTAFGGKDLCKQWGQDYITGSARWDKVAVDIVTNDAFNEINPGSKPDTCVDTFAAGCDSVRGLTIGRFISALVGALVAVPLAIMLLILTVFGLMAVVGVLFLAMMAPIFVLGWMIPGIPRTIGLKWFQALIGCMIQSALIAALLGVVMVLGAILQSLVPVYGFWMVGLLNVVVMIMALKVRSMFENLTGLSHPAASGLMSSYVAMKTLGTLGRMGKRVGHAGASAVGGTSRGIASAAAHGSAGYMSAGGKGLPSVTPSRIKNLDLRRHFPPKPEPGGIAPPYRTAPTPQTAVPAGSFAQTPQYHGSRVGGQYAVPGRTVDALPTSTPAGRRAITAVPSSLASTDAPTAQPPASSQPAKRRTPAKAAAPPRTFTSGSTSEPGVVQSAQRVTPMARRSGGPLSPPSYRADPLVITRLVQPVTSKAELLSHRKPPRNGDTS
jgi:hypothetical protein